MDPVDPGLVAFATTVEQIQAIVKRCGETKTPITGRVAGTNVGGLALPAPGGLVLDLSRMNRILATHEDDMVAVIEPGVTQQMMKDHLKDRPLTIGYSLAPPHTSVFANALLGGLTNRSLKYGDQSDWIAGLEVVRHDGTLARIGSWALSDIPFGLVPFPGLTGLFVGWQGTTGIVTKIAFQLWPKHPLNRRLFILSYSARGTYRAMSRLCRTEICDDIGGLSWPSAKMMMGVAHPDPSPQPGEPIFFLYVDLTAETKAEMRAKEDILARVLDEVRAQGDRFEDPLDIHTLVRAQPQLSGFADFPTDLKFLTGHGGGGLSWIGTYGPMSRMIPAVEEGMALMTERGFPPLIVSRPMRGGHFIVFRLIVTFDKKNEEEVARVRSLNEELLELATRHGFIMYKTPIWAWRRLEERIDPGMRRLMRDVKAVMDPAGIFNPGKLGLP
ncbi:MAG: FAD-binding oxidoreductase [Deltaproteobacteria bacterium]|nr:FAD-binding oxidoreductase [Deltaproteobacteria bacterium]